MPRKKAGPVADRKESIEDELTVRGRDSAGLRHTISRETMHKWVRRFPGGGYPSILAGC